MTASQPNPPLARRLSLRDGQRVWFSGMPEAVADEIDEYALDLIPVADPATGIDAAHVFVTESAELADRLAALRRQIAPDGQIWVSWPLPCAEQASDIDADAIRAIAEPLGFVDTKACAIDDTWSALKLVIRKDLR